MLSHTITDDITIDAPLSHAWRVIAHLPSIAKWGPGVIAAHVETTNTSGNGAIRYCDLANPGGPNGYMRELFSNWREEQSYTYEIVEGTIPIERGVTTITLCDKGNHTTNTTMTMHITPLQNMGTERVDAVVGALRKVVSQALTGLKDLHRKLTDPNRPAQVLGLSPAHQVHSVRPRPHAVVLTCQHLPRLPLTTRPIPTRRLTWQPGAGTCLAPPAQRFNLPGMSGTGLPNWRW